MTDKTISWPLIFGISGGAGHGKDTFGDMIAEELRENTDFKPVMLTFAKPVKEIAKIAFFLSDREVYTEEGKNRIIEPYGVTVRTLLQKVGTDLFRDMIHPDIWLFALEAELSASCSHDPSRAFIITDVRFPNETQLLRSIGKARIARVVRPGKTIKEGGHKSENLDVDQDVTILNDGTLSDLRHKAREFIISSL